MPYLKRFPATAFDAILCVMQLVIVGLFMLSPLPFGKNLGVAFLLLLVPHWFEKRSWPWWTFIGLGFVAILSSFAMIFSARAR